MFSFVELSTLCQQPHVNRHPTWVVGNSEPPFSFRQSKTMNTCLNYTWGCAVKGCESVLKELISKRSEVDEAADTRGFADLDQVDACLCNLLERWLSSPFRHWSLNPRLNEFSHAFASKVAWSCKGRLSNAGSLWTRSRFCVVACVHRTAGHAAVSSSGPQEEV